MSGETPDRQIVQLVGNLALEVVDIDRIRTTALAAVQDEQGEIIGLLDWKHDEDVVAHVVDMMMVRVFGDAEELGFRMMGGSFAPAPENWLDGSA